jgi:hypothetical protein
MRLLNIGEAVIFAASARSSRSTSNQALKDSLQLGGVEMPVQAGNSSPFGAPGRAAASAGPGRTRPPVQGVLFKEGNAAKLAKEKESIERWERLVPGLPPRIQAFQTDGESASMLLEYLGGCNLQQMVLTSDREIVENACFLVEQTLSGVWEQTLDRRPVPTDFMAQLRARLDDVYRLHPSFASGPKSLAGEYIASPAELLRAAEEVEQELPAPFSVYLHGDFNLNNLVYDHTAQRIHFIDLHRSKKAITSRMWRCFWSPTSGCRCSAARPAAAGDGDAHPAGIRPQFRGRPGGCHLRRPAWPGRGPVHGHLVRFEMHRRSPRRCFSRGMFLLERLVAHVDRPFATFVFPEAILEY